MNDTSRQILSTNKSISNQIAKFCRLTSRFCKILSIKTLFKQKRGIKYTLFKFPKSFDSGLNRSYFDEFSPLSRTFPDSPKIFSIKIPGFPEISSTPQWDSVPGSRILREGCPGESSYRRLRCSCNPSSRHIHIRLGWLRASMLRGRWSGLLRRVSGWLRG